MTLGGPGWESMWDPPTEARPVMSSPAENVEWGAAAYR